MDKEDETIISSYDDPSNVDAFLQFYQIEKGPTHLRGGERVVSQPFSEASVEILDYDELHELPREPLEKSTKNYKSVPPPHDPAAKGVRTPSPPIVPLAQHEMSKAAYASPIPAKPSPVVSIARRRVEHSFQEASSTSPCTNKLDDESFDNFMTPTQKAVLDRIKGQDIEGAASWQKAAAAHQNAVKPHVEHQEVRAKDQTTQQDAEREQKSEDKTVYVESPILTPEKAISMFKSSGPSARDAAFGTSYGVLDSYNQQIQAFFAKKAVSVGDAGTVKKEIEEAGLEVDIEDSKPKLKLDPEADEFQSQKAKTDGAQPDGTISNILTQYQIDRVNRSESDTRELCAKQEALEPSAQASEPAAAAEDSVEIKSDDPGQADAEKAPQLIAEDRQIEIKQEEDDVDDAKSEGGIDLAPVMQVIRSRSPDKRDELDADQAKQADTAAPTKKSGIEPKAPAITPDSKQVAEQTKTKPVIEETVASVAQKAHPAQADNHQIDSQHEYRTVVVRNLPETTDYTAVQSLIYGGQIETMHLDRQKHAAQITFTSTADCKRYVEAFPEGKIPFRLHRKNYIADVELSKTANQHNPHLQAILDCGATRVVVAENVLDDIPMRELESKAKGPSAVREVDAIFASYRGDCHTVIVRFTNILDAVSFKAMLSRMPELRAGLRFGEDPCAEATSTYHE